MSHEPLAMPKLSHEERRARRLRLVRLAKARAEQVTEAELPVQSEMAFASHW
jgi:hypothetical protein